MQKIDKYNPTETVMSCSVFIFLGNYSNFKTMEP